MKNSIPKNRILLRGAALALALCLLFSCASCGKKNTATALRADLRPGVYPRPPVLLHRAGALPAEKLHGGSAAPPAGWHHGRGLR